MAQKKEVVITCNATNVKAVIEGLERGMAALANEEERLLNTIKQRGYAEDSEKKRLKQLEKAMDALRTNIQKSREESKKFGQVMADLAGAKTKDLKRALNEGKRALDNMSSRDPNRQKLIDDLKRIQRQIEKNTSGMQKFGSTHNSVWQSAVRNITAYVGVFGAFNMLRNKLTDFIKKNMEFSDQLANIRKVSGLAMEDINELANRLAKIDTRSSIQELNNLAYTGAKLGFGNYGVEGLESFAKAAVKVQNALKEDMGEDAMTSLSKMVEVMGLIPKMGVEKAMDSAGSAIFKLASTSTATGTNIVEFSKRLMGLANIAHISTEDLLAFGSAADSMALMPEVAATAFNKLITAVQKQPNLIEKALSIPKGTISDLYQAGHMTEAIVTIFEKMREKGGMNSLMHSGVFKDLGSDGARLVAVMATMSNRVDILNQHLATSRAAFEDGTAVAQEYAIQMDTAAAYTERAANMWEKAFVNPEGVDMVKELTKEWYNLSKELTESEGFMVSCGMALNFIVTTLKVLITLAPALLIATVVRLLGQLVISLGMTRISVNALTASWKGLTTAMKANWISLAIGLVVEGIIWLTEKMSALTEEVEKSLDASNKFNTSLKELNQQAGEGEARMKRFGRAIEEAGKNTKQRQTAINNFNNEFGKYMSNLLTENATVQDLAKAYKEVTYWMRAERALAMKQKDLKEQVDTRDSWAIGHRTKYGENIKGSKYEQYNTSWLTSYAQDNRGKSISAIATDLGKRFGLSDKQITSVYNARGTDNWKSQLVGGGGFFSPVSGPIRNMRNIPQLREQVILHSALRYILQERSARYYENKVDEKYKPEQEAMDEWAAKQANAETYDPLDPARDKEAERAARAATAAARKEQAKAKAAMIKQMEQAKKDSTALIDNIEAYYNLQQTAVNESVKDGRRTADEAKALNKELEKKKDEALYQARLALTGEENIFDKMRKEQMGTDIDMLDYSELSQKILAQIVGVNLKEAYKNLSKFDGSEAVYGVNAGAFLNEIRNKATEYQKKRSEIEVKQLEDMQKILESYDLLEKLFGDTAEDFIKLGFPVADLVDAAMSARMRAEKTKRGATGGADVDAKHFLGDAEPLIEGKAEGRVNSFRQMLMQFLESGVEPYIINPKNDQELARWFLDFASNKRQDEAGNPIITKWASRNQEYSEWFGNLTGMRVDENGIFDAEDLEKTMAPIREKMQKFWTTLIGFEDNYYETLKKNYDRDKKLFTERWERSGQGEAFSDALTDLDMMQRQKKLTGADQGTHFGSMAGFTTLESDPEIAASMLRMEQARQELELLKQVSEDKRLIREQEQALAEAQMKLEETVMDKINERIKKLQEWTQPIEQFGESVGEAMGKALADGEKMSDGIKNALKSMVEAYGKSTIKIVTELMMQRLKKKMLYRAMQSDTKSETKAETQIEEEGAEQRLDARSMLEQGMVGLAQKWGMQLLQTKKQQDTQEMTQEGAKAKGKVAAGTAEGAADIIGKLGWWGIPLVAVITALLNGLLSMALNALFGSSSESSSSSSNSKNVKLVSGMLTYDSGNVQTVIGNDGQMYRARQIPGLPAGVSLITEPVATTVNGQPGLVGERGPELVIGRETTAAIMMNAPGLLQSLVDFDRYRSGARLYDTGNVVAAGSVPVTTVTGENTAIDPDTLAALRVLPQVMAALTEQLKKPVYINMFGTKGLYNELKNATTFMSKYGG